MSGGDTHCSAVIVAAGSAQRMQGIDKLLAPLDGVPVLRRTVEALASAPEIAELIVVTRADRLEAVQALCEGLSKPVSVVPGGKTRAESVLCGLSAAAMPYAAIHDGARPLVTNEVIAQAVSAAVSCGAAAPAVPVHDTIKRAESGLVLETPDRSTPSPSRRRIPTRSSVRWPSRRAAAHGRLPGSGWRRSATGVENRRSQHRSICAAEAIKENDKDRTRI
ncbi:MAG: 2-C-methyl-D-erythritol 4-phosphate cytidylyltransferase [Oscillospiraceae bacterium]